jgi:hypothetical protein
MSTVWVLGIAAGAGILGVWLGMGLMAVFNVRESVPTIHNDMVWNFLTKARTITEDYPQASMMIDPGTLKSLLVAFGESGTYIPRANKDLRRVYLRSDIGPFNKN